MALQISTVFISECEVTQARPLKPMTISYGIFLPRARSTGLVPLSRLHKVSKGYATQDGARTIEKAPLSRT
jgi:hypothetical protein